MTTKPNLKFQTIASRDSIERMPSSRNGNPRFRVTFTDGTSAPTAPDAGCAYGLENRENIGRQLTVEYNGRGHIVYVRPHVHDLTAGDGVGPEAIDSEAGTGIGLQCSAHVESTRCRAEATTMVRNLPRCATHSG